MKDDFHLRLHLRPITLSEKLISMLLDVELGRGWDRPANLRLICASPRLN